MSGKGIVAIVLIGTLVVGGEVFSRVDRHPKLEKNPRPHEGIEGTTDMIKYEAEGEVIEVVDGDTVDVELTWVREDIWGVWPGREERVRLGGGINAPDFYERGYEETKDLVHNLLPKGTTVYLDLDDLARSKKGRKYRDLASGKRLVGVIYVREENQWINLNAEILWWGERKYPEYDWLKYEGISSEFDPHVWLRENYPYIQDPRSIS